MAAITTTATESGTGRQRAGVKRMTRHNLKIDMTPMVDLGFLLITFFVITAQLSEHRAMNIITPKDGANTPLAMSDALTILPSANNTVYYYQGMWQEALKNGAVHQVNYAGENSLRKTILRIMAELDADPKSKEKRNGLMMVIKPDKSATYKNIVDILDEVTINQVKKYALVSITPEEAAWLEKRIE